MKRVLKFACPYDALAVQRLPCMRLNRHLIKLTVGYTPISAATLPFFIAIEEKLFQKHGLEVVPVFFGGTPLIVSAMMAGEFPIGLTGGGGIISSRLAGSDLTSSVVTCKCSPSTAWPSPRSSRSTI